MRLGVLGDIHGYLSGSDKMCIDFAVNLTATLAVHAFLQVGDMCHYRSFARPVHWIYGNNDWPDVVRQVETGERPLQHLHHLKTGEVRTLSHGTEHVRIAGLNGAFDDLYSLNQLKDEYYILDTSSWTLERFPSRSRV